MGRLINEEDIVEVFYKTGWGCEAPIAEILKEIPTAYDKEKVIADLEGFMDEAEQFGVSGMVSDMIEVVRNGGVE